MKKYLQYFTNIILGLFVICFLFVIGCVLFYPQTIMVNFNVFVLLLGVLGLFLVYLFLHSKLGKMKFSESKIFWILFVLFIIIQSFLAYQLTVEPSWDFGTVYQAVVDDINSVTKIYQNNYFYMFQNNVALAYMLKTFFLLFKFCGCTNYLLAGIIFNIICIDVTVFVLYRTLHLIFPKINKTFFLFLLLFTLPFITYAPIFYTDTISMPFLVIPLYCFIYFITQPCNDKKSKIIAGICGVFLGVGLQVKFTIVILLIAFFAYFFLQEEWKKKWSLWLILGLSLLAVVIPTKLISNRLFDSQRLEQTKVPITHWIMMGLKDHGQFNYEDYATTFEAGAMEAKKNTNIKIIKERFSNLVKKHQVFKFYAGKVSYLWCDGTYYAAELLRISKRKTFFQEVFLMNGKYYSGFSYLSQIQHILTLFMVFCSVLFSKYLTENEKKIRNLCLIAILGVFFFFIIWEASHRYLLHMLPILLISSFIGMEAIFRFFSEKQIFNRFILKLRKEKEDGKSSREKIKL